MRSFFIFGACFVAAAALATAAGTSVPELEAGRAKYQEALTTIRAQRDRDAASVNQTYAESLRKLHAKFSGEGESEAAAAVEAEQERAARGVEPTNQERRTMTGLMLALRVAYEKARAPMYMPAAKSENAAHAAWSAGLAQLHAHFTRLRQLEQAAVVQAERDRLVQPAAPATVPPGAPVYSGPKLEAAVADRIKAAIAQKTPVATEVSGKRKGESESPADGAVLVGFDLCEFGWKGRSVKALEPIYLGRTGVVKGASRGKFAGIRQTIKALDGYAVGGINVHSHDRIAGFQVVFMKMLPTGSKLDPATTYASKWFGTQLEAEPSRLGGDGRLVIGVHGATGADADTIGLVQLP